MPRSLQETHARARQHERRRRWSRDYPSHPMVDYEFKLKRKARAALTKFKRVRPFRLEGEAFVEAVRTLYADLAAAYDMPAPSVRHAGSWDGDSGSSTYGRGHAVTLRGRRSVLTALHEFTHARGYGEVGAVWWSVNAFRLTWPRSFARLAPQRGSHFLTRSSEHAERTPEEAEAAWRAFYAERDRAQQAQRQAQAAAAAARAEARALMEQREPPEGATPGERRLWPRLYGDARRAVVERIQQRTGRDAAARAAEAERVARAQHERENPPVRTLDLTDYEPETDEDAAASIDPTRMTAVILDAFGEGPEPTDFTPNTQPEDAGQARFRGLDLS